VKPLLYTVCPRPAHPTRDGAAIRNYYLLRALARVFRVKTLVLLPPHLRRLAEEWPDGVEVERIRQKPRSVRRAGALAESLLKGGDYSSLLYRSRPLTLRLSVLCAREKPNWVLAQSYHVAPLVPDAAAPLWIDFHNVDSEIWRRIGQSHPSRLKGRFALSQAPRVRRLETRLVARADGISCVSARDARQLEELGPRVPPLVVPNGVDLERYRCRTETRGEEIIFFVGDLTWPPNAEGLLWFEREVWPAIRRNRPAARVEVLGRGAPVSSDDRFRYLGEGGDTRPYWACAAVSVVPLRAGGGTRLKILEAAAAGVPVVSTRLGAEGLTLAEGTEILLHDDPAAFAAAVSNLLSNRDLGRQQAAAARRRVEESYGWEEIGERFARELLRRGRHGRE
jgi:glycosyltransferase involved in cell wall biosynthesis